MPLSPGKRTSDRNHFHVLYGPKQTSNFRRACPDAIQNLTFASVSGCCYRFDLN